MTGEDQKKNVSDVGSAGSPAATSPSSAGRSQDAQRAFEQQRTMRIYVVERGDNLSRIARKFYGEASAWKRIYEENRDVIQNPDLVEPGWKLRIPD